MSRPPTWTAASSSSSVASLCDDHVWRCNAFHCAFCGSSMPAAIHARCAHVEKFHKGVLVSGTYTTTQPFNGAVITGTGRQRLHSSRLRSSQSSRTNTIALQPSLERRAASAFSLRTQVQTHTSIDEHTTALKLRGTYRRVDAVLPRSSARSQPAFIQLIQWSLVVRSGLAASNLVDHARTVQYTLSQRSWRPLGENRV